ncbi:MAG: GNAT family N-acetyltransferase [Bacteroidales bacterium]|nr:GNAT family N-acetyltransferase [Bacteroidales bacterium]MCF8387633.1 GNAT family N-acetyltransferase [Bacteroidales bacterium]MCF8397941.1 GNAT family N-acetyltransferase [Bacteroidales bacterium]
METIISPVDVELLEKELTEEIFVRNTNNGHNEIYVFDHHNSPHLMKEVGRLREITFREAGGGTGKSYDMDAYDTAEVPFKQLIVWNPRDKEITGGYRFMHGKEMIEVSKGKEVESPTSRLFKISKKFVRDFMPYAIELGRSFVQPNYQPTYNLRKGMYSLDNLWDGLGAIVIDNPDVKYLFGKVTMYPQYDRLARDLVLFFLGRHFPDNDNLIIPRKPLLLETDEKILNNIFTGCNFDEDYKILVNKVRQLNEGIPPLINAYMTLSATMRTFGTTLNEHFGNVEETGILLTIEDIYDFKKDRHISTYKKDQQS